MGGGLFDSHGHVGRLWGIHVYLYDGEAGWVSIVFEQSTYLCLVGDLTTI